MKKNSLTKMLLTITMVLLTITVFTVSVFAYYELLITNTGNVIKAGNISSNIEIYVKDDTGTLVVDDPATTETDEIKLKKIDSITINDVYSQTFDVKDDNYYYFLIKSNELSTLKLYGGIDLSSSLPTNPSIEKEISKTGTLFYVNGKGTYTYWSKTKDSTSIYTNSSSTPITLGNDGFVATEDLTVASATSNSITLNAITTTGVTDIKYAKNTSKVAPTNESNWQDSVLFSGLTEGTDYYFFVKYKKDGNTYISTGKLLGLGYSVTFDLQTSKMVGDSKRTMVVTFVDGTTATVEFRNRGTEDGKFDVDFSDTSIADIEPSFPYTFYNVNKLDREDSFITYTKNGIEQTAYEFKNGSYVVSSDITIIGTGTGNCLDENTMITMWDGSLKAMKDIEVNDLVLSIDYETMTLVPRKVIYTSKNEVDYDNWTVGAYYLHTFSDGTQIKRSMRHRFYNLEDESYKHMHTWENGLHTYKIDGTNPTLVSTEIINETLHYARITLEGSNNYFANGLSTGDSECCPNKVVLNTKLEKTKIN